MGALPHECRAGRRRVRVSHEIRPGIRSIFPLNGICRDIRRADDGAHAIANWRAFSYLGNVVTAESGGVTSTIVHDSFPVTVSVFPAWSVATERNWYVWPSWPVNDPEVVAAVATSQSVQPAPLSFT